MKKRLFSVVGPTGIGKTKLAIAVAKYFGTEIVSCDARQFFAEMPIGTAAPTEDELAQVKHHFIGNLSVVDEYSIGQYEKDALEKLEKLFSEGGIEALQKLLKELDDAYYQIVDKENPRRLMRALDIIWQTGKTYMENIENPLDKRDFEVVRIGISADREIVYNRINQRVDLMVQNGLLEEAKNLIPYKDKTALQTVGYTELFKYFSGEWELDFAISEIKKNSRRYAKRQLTWLRKLENIHWIKYDYTQEELEKLLEIIKK